MLRLLLVLDMKLPDNREMTEDDHILKCRNVYILELLHHLVAKNCKTKLNWLLVTNQSIQRRNII